MSEFLLIFINVVMPLLTGMVYFAMARYVKHIGPMRTLVTGKLTYDGAYWGFLLLGLYLATRPLQIFLGPHPMPLIVNCIREFAMIGFFGPAVTVAMLSLVLGSANVPKNLVRGIFGLGIVLGISFVVVNATAVKGSELIFKMGQWPAHEAIWARDPGSLSLRLPLLFVIRLIDPVFFIFGAGTLVLWHAYKYPPEKKALYDNMPKKLYLMGIACYAFSLSMLSVSFIFLFTNISDYWWIYYVGALASGLLETFSLAMPLRREVQITEHA